MHLFSQPSNIQFIYVRNIYLQNIHYIAFKVLSKGAVLYLMLNYFFQMCFLQKRVQLLLSWLLEP